MYQKHFKILVFDRVCLHTNETKLLSIIENNKLKITFKKKKKLENKNKNNR